MDANVQRKYVLIIRSKYICCRATKGAGMQTYCHVHLA